MKRRKLIFVLGFIIIFAIYIGYPYLEEMDRTKDGFKEEIIRFHVIANSDSNEDQALKLKVRDRILEEMDDKLGTCNSIQDSREAIKGNLDDIKYIALDEIHREGKEYDVDVSLGMDSFPTKSYGDITLPQGEYEALKVVIGEGKGKNWWCVMFPPLCFVDITHGVSKNVEPSMKGIMTEDEYNSILTEKPPEIKLKSKTVEIVDKVKDGFERLFIGDYGKFSPY
jgi:stage II sporulation protein R